jgi:hypothetical protein
MNRNLTMEDDQNRCRKPGRPCARAGRARTRMLRSLALHVRKCVPAISVSRRDGTAGAYGNHQEQAHANSADGRGQDKRADAKRGTDLPDELLAGGRTTHAGNRDAILHHDIEGGGKSKKVLP